MDHTLGELTKELYAQVKTVLILVLVDHTLGGSSQRLHQREKESLNPCFSGPYSRSDENVQMVYALCVLILVLVDHTLGVYTSKQKFRYKTS